MNEKEQIVVAKIIEKVYDFHLSKYHYLFLSQMAIRRYELMRKKKTEDIELWKQIINICSTHNIDLEIRGDDSPLKKLNIKTKGKLSNV